MDFTKLMDGFVEATSKSGPEGGLRFLEGAEAALKSNLRTEAHNPSAPETGTMKQGIENSPYAYLTQDRFHNGGSE